MGFQIERNLQLVKKKNLVFRLRESTNKMMLLRVALIFLLTNVNKDAKGAAVDINEIVTNFTSIVTNLKENFKNEKARMEATIATLQDEMDANKKALQTEINTNMMGLQNLIDEEDENIADTMNVVTKLEKMSRLGTSCTQLAHQGNLESGYYLLDTDGMNGNQPPYDAYCK